MSEQFTSLHEMIEAQGNMITGLVERVEGLEQDISTLKNFIINVFDINENFGTEPTLQDVTELLTNWVKSG